MRNLRLATLGALVAAGWLACQGPAAADTLTLNDGTVLHGEIRALRDDVYTVQTDTLGTVRVHKQDVRSIDHGAGATSTPAPLGNAPLPGAGELEAMQLRLMQDPNLLAMIQALQSDPEVLAVLSDPEIMAAIAAGDYEALMNHPKIIALTRNPSMQSLVDQVR